MTSNIRWAAQYAAILVGLTMAGSAVAQDGDTLKLGYINTLSGPAGAYGVEMLNAYNLGLEHTGGKLGGKTVELITGDDQAKPQIAIQIARQMLQRDDIDLMSGLLFSHVGEAVNSVILPADRMVVASVGGSSNLAGAGCEANYFIASWNTDTMFEAIGAYLKKEGVERVAAIATNYQAGWDAVSGLKLGYEGELVSEILVQLNQSDFGAELSQIRAADPQALVMFLPGGSGIAFQRQFNQSGMQETVDPYLATFQADETTFGALGDAAAGTLNAGPWNPEIDNPANRKFVEAFNEKYGRNPSILAAMAYDTVLLLDAAIGAVDGNVRNLDAFREALETVEFDSVRGNFSFANNHFPIQDFYISEITKGEDGTMRNTLVTRIFEQKADSHTGECQLN
jgi:branched-chain amino acid transport system substrate-binding protein